jgi:thiosulfate/3-mercaptopyruvate sulfurtransferase
MGMLMLSFALQYTALAQPKENILVTPEWVSLQRNMSDLVILQVDAVKADFDREHVPGSQFLWPEWLGPNTPAATLNAPDQKTATEVLQRLGVNKGSYVVVCNGSGDPTLAARMFATLESLGLKSRVHYLNGGLEAWKKAGMQVSYSSTPVKKGTFTIFNPVPVFVEKDRILKTQGSGSSIIIDARAKSYFEGEPYGYPRDGRIRGSVNLFYKDLFEPDGTLKPQDELARKFSAIAPDRTKPLLTYCFTGQTASMVYLAGRTLGYDMKIYDGSMQEWSRDPKLPMDK